MVLKIFTKNDGPDMRAALEFGKELEAEAYQVEYHDADDQASTQLVELYDTYSYPAFIVTSDQGEQVEAWKGLIPLKFDVKQFLNS